jgi:hypothetical protein
MLADGAFSLCRGLMENVSKRLIVSAELSRVTADAVDDRNDNLLLELGKQFEEEPGAKERAFEALRRHRAEHGC